MGTFYIWNLVLLNSLESGDMSVVRRFQLHILELDEIASSLRESAGSLEEAGIAVMQLATQTARTRPNSPRAARILRGQCGQDCKT